MTGKELLRLTSPVIAMGTVWIAQKALYSVYKKTTGHEAPAAEDLETPVVRVLLFATTAAVVSAVLTTGVTRALAQATQGAPADLYSPEDM